MRVISRNTETREHDTIPEGWTLLPVSRLIEEHFSGPSPDCEERPIVSDQEWGVLKTTAITWAGWNENANKVLPRAYWGRRELEIKNGDVLITKAGPRDRVGVVVHVTSEPHNLIVSGKMIDLRPRRDLVLPRILAGSLTLRSPQQYIHARTTGMAESQVNFANTVLLDTKVSIPSMPEQARIAAVLDMVDAAITQTEDVIAKLKQVRAGLLHDLLIRGLDEHGQLRSSFGEAPHLYQDSPLGKIPRDWKVDSLVSRVSLPQGQVDPREQPYTNWILVAPDHIDSGTGRLIATRSASEQNAISGKYVFESGDVVYSKIRPYLRKAILATFRGLCSADMYPLKPAAGVNSRFLLAVVLGEAFSRFASAVSMRSGFPKINREELAEFRLGWPKPQEQERIGEILTVSDHQELAIEAEIAKLRLIKSGLTSDLLAGHIRIPETLDHQEPCP